ncbi:HAD-IA family hydrolase [Spirulina subsalsa FACHB-351]|uniref:HAD-IA family hydrolase n=1 Tax=Spirulina subsalsa FACHB-351 TaxID=234711 RepID=A0ABT3L077_9CYAN|nr:HAD-IA family hydrolase [Spirulina subsalsa]MCW6034892.1 HAD-IA family hydrolase [Spirulina subsalsa FACHB-351]
MLNAILFDLDGTLVNTDSLHFDTWITALKPLGISMDRPTYDRVISGKHNDDIVQDILSHLPLEEARKVAEEKERLFRQMGEKLSPVAGLNQMLNWADQQQLKQGVITNAPRENAEFMLKTLDLWERFPVVIVANDAPKGKPDPAPYQLALSRLEIESDGVLVFEDSPSGIRSAVGAGLYTIGIASTHPVESLLRAGAKQVIEDFTDSTLWEILALF